MLDEKGTEYDGESSYIWLWMEQDERWLDPMRVGNIEQGGKAGGKGCWLHEISVVEGGNFDFAEELEWCGEAPHHQVWSLPTYSLNRV